MISNYNLNSIENYQEELKLLNAIYSIAARKNVIIDGNINHLVNAIFDAKEELVKEHIPGLKILKERVTLFNPQLPNQNELSEKIEATIQTILTISNTLTLKTMAVELRAHILSFLPLGDVSKFARVCHQFASECKEELFKFVINQGDVRRFYKLLVQKFEKAIVDHPTEYNGRGEMFTPDHPICQLLAPYMDYFFKHASLEMQSQLWACMQRKHEKLFRALITILPQDLDKLMLSSRVMPPGIDYGHHNALKDFLEKGLSVFKTLGLRRFNCLKEFHIVSDVNVSDKNGWKANAICRLAPILQDVEKLTFRGSFDCQAFLHPVFKSSFTRLHSLSLSLHGGENSWGSGLTYFLGQAKNLTSLEISFNDHNNSRGVLEHLAPRTKQLQALTISQVVLTDEQALLRFIKEMPNIETVKLTYANIGTFTHAQEVTNRITNLTNLLKVQGFNLKFRRQNTFDFTSSFEIERQTSNKRKISEVEETNDNSAPKKAATLDG